MEEFPEDDSRPRMMAPCAGYYCKNTESVPLVRDPFIWEIYDEEVLVHLCDECFGERCDEI